MRDVIEIGTPRLKLRRLRMSDAQRIAQFCDDPGVGRNLAQTPLPYLPVAAEGWILINAARASRGTDFVYAVELPGEGLIGAIGAHARGQRADEIIGLEFRAVEPGDAQPLAELAAALELQHQVGRRRGGVLEGLQPVAGQLDVQSDAAQQLVLREPPSGRARMRASPAWMSAHSAASTGSLAR